MWIFHNINKKKKNQEVQYISKKMRYNISYSYISNTSNTRENESFCTKESYKYS